MFACFEDKMVNLFISSPTVIDILCQLTIPVFHDRVLSDSTDDAASVTTVIKLMEKQQEASRNSLR